MLSGYFNKNLFLSTSISTIILISSANSFAVGSNTSNPLPTPPTPAPVITNTPDLNNVNDGGCVEQYDARFNQLTRLELDATTASVTAAGIGVAAELTEAIASEAAQTVDATQFGLMAGFLAADVPAVGTATPAAVPAGILAGSSTGKAIATGALIVGLASSTASVISDGVALAREEDQYDLQVYVDTLPECNTTFTGTVKVTAGGFDVTGDSIVKGNLAVDGDASITGSVNVSKLEATQGISAFDGAISIGDPSLETYSSGITLGGGALSGAGTGGAQAFTGHVDAIAIGNNATAQMSGSIAFGLDAQSNEVDGVAIGNTAIANGVRDVVVGSSNNTGAGGDNTVVGNNIDVIGDGSTNNTILGAGHQVTGSGNFVGGDPITVVGSNNVAQGNNGTVTGDSNVAVGNTVNVTGNSNVVIGDNASATGNDTTAIGTSAQANANGSAAFGQGAVASLDLQQVFGTVTNTYAMPGITSDFSRSRQTGPLELLSSDIPGNLATDGGLVFRTLSEHQAGIATAMAMVNPSLNTEEKFGLSFNIAGFKGSQAIGLAAMGVLHEDVFGGGERLSLTGGLGISVNESTFAGHKSGRVGGGRVGAQLTW